MVDNFTPIEVHAPALAVTFNDPMQELSDAIGNRDLLQTPGTDLVTQINTILGGGAGTAIIPDGAVANVKLAPDVKVGSLAALLTAVKTSVQAAINEVYTRLAGISNSDGTLKDGAVSSGAKLADGIVTGPKIDPAAVSVPSIVYDPRNVYVPVDATWGGRNRWFVGSNCSLVAADPGNPYGGRTLRIGTAASNGGKLIWLDEIGAGLGAVLSFRAVLGGASGSGTLACRFYTSAGTPLLTQKSSATQTFNGTVKVFTVLSDPVPATAAYCYIFPVRMSGTAPIDVYELIGSTGAYLSAVAAPTLPAPITSDVIVPASIQAASLAPGAAGPPPNGTVTVANLIPDPFNLYTNPATSWGGRLRWQSPTNLTLLPAAAPNPYTSPALEIGTAAAFGGKNIWLDEAGMGVGDVISIAVECAAASGTANLAYRFFTAASVGVGTQVSSANQLMDGTVKTFRHTAVVVPATAAYLGIYIVRASGTVVIDIFSMWCAKASALPSYPGTSAAPTYFWQEIIDGRGGTANLNARFAAIEGGAASAFPDATDTYGMFNLRDWQTQLARIVRAESGQQAVIAFVGDSWVENDFISAPLRSWLKTTYGDAGIGYCTADSLIGAPVGVTRTTAGTWTDRDNTDTPVGYGPDIGSTRSSDIATPASKAWTATLTDARLLYLIQPNGGSFRWQVDAGAWTTVATAGTLAIGTVDIPSQASGSHTVKLEVTVAGTAGVEILGIDLKILGVNGVRLHRIGNGGATAGQYASATAALWQATLAALAPNLTMLLLGTNDDSVDIVPATFGTSVTTLVTQIRAARSPGDVLLMPCAANGLAAGSYPTSSYVTQMRNVAVAQSTACFDMSKTISNYTVDNARGLYSNTSHLSALGGQVVGDRLIRLLRAQ